MQEQSANHAFHLEQQLSQCMEVQQKIQQDNQQLRHVIGTLVQQLQGSLPVPSDTARPSFRQNVAMATQAAQAASRTAAEDVATAAISFEQANKSGLVRRASEATSPESSLHGLSTEQGAVAASVEEPASLVSFNITLRRASDIPLGLELEASDDGKHFVIKSVRSGGAVESWNRQCNGDAREIRNGDHLVKINEVDGVDAMLSQCRDKYLLKLTVERGNRANFGT